MNRRELERWVAANRDRLSTRGVRVLFGFGPPLDGNGGASWASFLSGRGSGRLVRGVDGSSQVDAYAFADGACLRQDRNAEASVEQLESLSDLLATGVGSS